MKTENILKYTEVTISGIIEVLENRMIGINNNMIAQQIINALRNPVKDEGSSKTE